MFEVFILCTTMQFSLLELRIGLAYEIMVLISYTQKDTLTPATSVFC